MFFGRPAGDFLNSLGFSFTAQQNHVEIPFEFNIDKLIENRHHRIECRNKIGTTQYGLVFEYIVEQLLLSRFKFDILRGVKIEDEGTGGDYDILAFQSPHLHYIECKTSSTIKFEEIYKRHKFLRPSLTLILIDRPKKDVEKIIREDIQDFLTKEHKSTSPYPVKLISAPSDSEITYHTSRNIFIASGENLDRAIRRTLRYFHQVVQQSSYFS